MSEMRKRLLLHLVKQGKLSKEAARHAGAEGRDQHMKPKGRIEHFDGEVKPKAGLTCPNCGYSLDHIPVAATAGEACPVCGFGWADELPRAHARGGVAVGHSPSGMTHGAIKHFTRSQAGERSAYARGGMVDCPHCGYAQDRSGSCVRCGHEIKNDDDMAFAHALKFRRH